MASDADGDQSDSIGERRAKTCLSRTRCALAFVTTHPAKSPFATVHIVPTGRRISQTWRAISSDSTLAFSCRMKSKVGSDLPRKPCISVARVTQADKGVPSFFCLLGAMEAPVGTDVNEEVHIRSHLWRPKGQANAHRNRALVINCQITTAKGKQSASHGSHLRFYYHVRPERNTGHSGYRVVFPSTKVGHQSRSWNWTCWQPS